MKTSQKANFKRIFTLNVWNKKIKNSVRTAGAKTVEDVLAAVKANIASEGDPL